jgi:crotonobetainyl-CoA:carnitine CoA-transferase CaiB-like acyl-CoA transferase
MTKPQDERSGPLSGIRVVEAGTMITAPLAAMMLGDQGADVIKIESPGIGDVMRYLGETVAGTSALWLTCNRSKRGVALNLGDAQGQVVARRLLAGADIVIQNFRPGVVDRLGIGEPAVRAENPGVIYVSISGYGFTGPMANRPAYDNIIQAATGVAAAQTDPLTGQPSLIRNLVCDKITAYTVAQAATAALFARERHHRLTGALVGQHLRVAMIDATLAFLWSDAMMGETFLDRDKVTPGPVIGQAYTLATTADGFVTSTMITEGQFRGMANAIGHPEWATDPRLQGVAGRVTNIDVWRGPLAEFLASTSTDEVVRRFVEHDVPCTGVTTLSDVASHPQVIANATLTEHDRGAYGRLREPRPPVDFSTTPARIGAVPPHLGADTDAVLTSLGYTPDELTALRATGAIA